MTTVAHPRYRDVFGVGEFRVLFSLHTLVAVGDAVKTLALAVLVFDQTGSSLAAALVFGATMLPYAVGGTLLLSLADRVPVRRLLTGYHALRFGTTALLAAVVLPVPATLLLLALVGLFAPVAGASVQTQLPELLPGDSYVLGRSLFTMTAAGAQVLGQALGGVLLLTLSATGALWLSAGSGLLGAAIALCGLPARPAPGVRAEGGAARQTWRVNRRLFADRSVRGLMLAQWLPIALSVGAEGAVVPYAASLGHAEGAGAILAFGAVGLFAGNFVVGRFVPPARRDRAALPLAMLTGVPLTAFALDPSLPIACALMMTATFGLSYELMPQRRLVETVPETIRGQALGLANTGLMSGQAVGIMAAGVLGEWMPPGTAMAVCGAAAALTALALARHLRGPVTAPPRA
ncbi:MULTISPECIES: MFS transporter [Actinomadura]|uniref:MFS transporter n=1 Tax=Actinomadura yumaensis TaxID=111807 RepID=A0ABW2CQ33_9ACTN|nr:MFS transporter [Actinomadura sp. J1-007]MWK34299.1 MFS transporter [Actinomadura sp. J1-007]